MFSIKYERSTIKRFILNAKEAKSDAEDKIAIMIFAFALDTLPIAKGRNFLVGCFLSSSTSSKSLNTYMLLAIRLKRANAPIV